MTKKELLEQIATVTPLLATYQSTGTVKISPDDRQKIRDLYNEIIPYSGNSLCISCDNVILHVLNIMLSYYEREIKTLPVNEPVIVQAADAEPAAVDTKDETANWIKDKMKNMPEPCCNEAKGKSGRERKKKALKP